MSRDLKTYRDKRDFTRTQEPPPAASVADHEPFFVVQQHAASRLHYDFRLAIGGVLASWAVPKGPSLDPDDKRLAVQTEDHPLSYADFEGNIPAGEYGGGAVQLWDRGAFESDGDPAAALKKGHLRLTLHGQKLTGGFDLVRIKDSDRAEWLLRKRDDAAARPEVDTRGPDFDWSITTGRSLQQVAEQAPPQPRRGPAADNVSRDAEDTIPQPQKATLVEDLPSGPRWVFEVKWDGYRLLAWRREGRVRLFTSSGLDWTERFRPLLPGLERLPGGSWTLDGEAVVLDAKGRSDFGALQQALRGHRPEALRYVVFDLLDEDDKDLRGQPLRARKERLQALLRTRDKEGPLSYSEHFTQPGNRLFQAACERGLEGVIAKDLESPYEAGRQLSWRKVKCVQRQEFAIVGYSAPQGSRKHLGALLLATREGETWRYRGKVGTGFNSANLPQVLAALKPLQVERPVALAGRPRLRDVTWVRPERLAEVRFAELTGDGHIRHGVFEGLREDKPAVEAQMEQPADPSPPTPMPARTARTDPELAGITISHPDRVIDKTSGATKLDLARYYAAVAEVALPYVARRPLSLVRCPQGRGKCFFQKHLADSVPPGVKTVEIPEKSGFGTYSYVTDATGLVALVQFGTLEFHAWGSRVDRPDQPDQLIFDLDPDEAVAWEVVLGATLLLRDILAEVGLTSFLKSTGGKGLHVCVPLTRGPTWEVAKPFAKGVAEALVARNPQQFLAKASKAARAGKIFVDYLRNGVGATAIVPYAARARPGLTVALPLSWDDLPRERPTWTIREVPDVLARRSSDPWAAYTRTRQSLTVKRLAAFGIA